MKYVIKLIFSHGSQALHSVLHRLIKRGKNENSSFPFLNLYTLLLTLAKLIVPL
jgi:hypothetical protein